MVERSVLVRIKGDANDLNRALLSGSRELKTFSTRLNTANDSTSWLVQGLAAISPAVVPIGVQAVPIVAGLTAQLGAASLAAGTAVVAFQGVGDAMQAYLAAKADPSAANLAALRTEMKSISPAAQALVGQLADLTPRLRGLRNAVASNMLPGVSEGLDDLVTMLPRVRALMTSVARANGQLAMDAGKALAGDDWAEFFSFLQREAAPTTLELGRSIGNVTKGLASLLVAFEPVERQWSAGMLRMSRSFADWAAGVDQTQGFAEFLDYLQSTGPQVLATVESLANMILQVAEAAAPLGGPVLAGIRAVADAVAAIADSSVGPALLGAVIGVNALSRALALKNAVMGNEAAAMAAQRTGVAAAATGYQSQVRALGGLPAAYRAASAAQQTLTVAQKQSQAATAAYVRQLQTANTMRSRPDLFSAPSALQQARLADSLGRVEMANFGVAAATDKARAAEVTRSRVLRESATGMAKTAAGAAGLAFAMSGAADSTGLANTASLALMGTMLGSWGAAVGGAIGLLMDGKAQGDQFAGALDRVNAALSRGDMARYTAEVDALTAKLADRKNISGFGDMLQDFFYDRAADSPLIPDSWFPNEKELSSKLKQIKDMRDAALEVSSKGLGTGPVASAGALLNSLNLLPPAYANLGRSSAWVNTQLAASRKTNRDTAMSFVGLGKSVNDSQVGLNEWIRNMTRSAQAVREFGTNALIAADRGLRQGLIKQLQAAGPEGALRMKQLADGTDAQIRRANRATNSQTSAVRAYIDALSGVPGSKSVKIAAPGTPQARAAIKLLRGEIESLKDKTVRMDEKGAAKARDRIALLRAAIASLRDKTVTTTLRERKVVVGGKIAQAAGGIHVAGTQVFAGGGFAGMWGWSPDRANGHTAHFARGGTNRLFAEPETGGEAYIPLADDWRRPRARAIAAETVRLLGGTAAFAGGGLINEGYLGDHLRRFAAGGTYATGPGVSVVFPAPAVYAAAVAAADKIAASGAKYTASAQELRQVRLDDLRLQQQIAQTRKSLAEREDKIVGKGKNKKTLKGQGALSLTGIDRTVAQAELADLSAQLAETRRLNAIQSATAEAVRAAVEAQQQARKDAADRLSGLGDIFAGSPARAVMAVNREIQNVAAYGEVIAKLKSAGASPALLGRVVAFADSGDITGAVRFGQRLLAQSQSIGQLNAGLATLGTVAASVANLTTDPRLMAPGAWNPAALAPSVAREVTVNLMADPSTWQTTVAHQVKNLVINEMRG